MLYTRSSFLKYLKDKHDCEIKPHSNGKVITIKNGPVTVHIGSDKNNRMDYDEIYLVCNRLYLVDLPGSSDLELIE